MAQPQHVRLSITAELVAQAQASTAAASVAAAQDGVPEAAVAVGSAATVILPAQQGADPRVLLTARLPPAPPPAPEPAAEERPGLRFFTADGLSYLARGKTCASQEAMSFHLMSSQHVKNLKKAMKEAKAAERPAATPAPAADSGGDVRESKPAAAVAQEPASQTQAAELVGGSQSAAQASPSEDWDWFAWRWQPSSWQWWQVLAAAQSPALVAPAGRRPIRTATAAASANRRAATDRRAASANALHVRRQGR